MSDTVQLELPWSAYTSEHFDRIYNEHAARIGHRPQFTVTHGGDYARVTTNTGDADEARAIISDLVAAAKR